MQASAAPQVRTLLFTDMVDSTHLVERLGDAPAADLFRAHDRIVLELQQRWRGRLIDRSDGLLLIFDRPIDGLGFALDYLRGLRDLGQQLQLTQPLQARAGLHVGEVLLWENDAEAVRQGAKSLEVEGLAKPLAARLMTLARPGQILLSATAEPLAHRAARELGERGDTLVWKSYGRWRFKGVPEAQEVCEVGEPGLAPLRMPAHTPKAWRDLPLWRRPVALAVEAVMVLAIAAGVWFLMHPTPALAFNERDWVVVGDLRNLTGDPRLDDTLEQAFMISLEQSRYVNILSDLKVRETLQRMQRPANAQVDRTNGSEIALRDGARALLLPTVAEVGGRLRVSVEVIDPHTQATVYAVIADGKGIDSALSSIDEVTDQLRAKLGEALDNVQKTSVPLPNVSTPNLDALKAYALGRNYFLKDDPRQALAFYQRAYQLDPGFALAHLEAGNVYAAKFGDFPMARQEFAIASRLRARLSPREGLFLDATLARLGPPGPAMQRWQQLIDLYPDQLRARQILGQMELFMANRPDLALVQARAAAIKQFEGRAPMLYLQGAALLAMQRYPEAIRQFDASRQAGFSGAVYFHAYAYAAQRDWGNMRRVVATRKPTGSQVGELEVKQNAALFALDQGQWQAALQIEQQAYEASSTLEPVYQGATDRIALLAMQLLAGTRPHDQFLAELDADIRKAAQRMREASEVDRSNQANQLQALGYLAALNGTPVTLRHAIASVDAWPGHAGYPLTVQMQEILRAEVDRLEGHPEAAIQRLRALVGNSDALVHSHSALLRSLRATGDDLGVVAQANWLVNHRGLAYMDQSAGVSLQLVAVADTTVAHLDAAEAWLRRGEVANAAKERAAFLQAWPLAQLPASTRERLARLRL